MSDNPIDTALIALGLPVRDLNSVPSSDKRFSDGGQYRIEIPSTEGPGGLAAVIHESEALGVPVHRISQGSGVVMLTDRELDQVVELGSASRIEVSLFARPNAGWTASATTAASAGAGAAAAARGADQLCFVLDDIVRAANHGIRSVLIADLGVLSVFGEMRSSGLLPSDMQAKISAMFPVSNPATAKVLAQLGADSLNLQTDLDLAQIAAIRAAVDIPLDLYVEAPANLGGFVNLNLIPEIVRIAAPVYLKFGLRNGPDVYPTGAHLDSAALAMTRERVRRARLGLELLERSGFDAQMSAVGGHDLRVPQSVSTHPFASLTPTR